MVIGVLTLSQSRKSRLVTVFEEHCRRFVSDAYIPGMVAPVMERRIFLGPVVGDGSLPGDDSSS
jgi:hypothetical protein